MKLTCLSEGGGFHFPPCHLLNVCGFRVLFDCPLDLSMLTIFSPVMNDSGITLDEDSSAPSSNKFSNSDCVDKRGQKIEKPLDANSLIHAEPCYKIIKNLHQWNASFIDIVLISSPMGMLGLPFLTRNKGFTAKIYVTEATARLGQLMMEDLLAMHMEFKQSYGPEEYGFPQWMRWEELEKLPLALREIALGKDGRELGGWMPLYSAADVKDCAQKVRSLKYAEEVCYNGTLIIKAFSSGLEIGACNWTINGPKRNLVYLSSSIFISATAANFNYQALRGTDVIIYSDLSSCDIAESVGDYNCSSLASKDISTMSDDDDSWKMIAESMLCMDESLEEIEKLSFICSCAFDSLKEGGSVLISIGRLGIVLQLLEHISSSLKYSNLKVPIFVVSHVAEELLAFSNIIPEWLCLQRQEKLYTGEALFAHVELIKEKRLHLFPAVHSLQLLKILQEPCIVFCPHWNMRLGPVVHFLQHWRGDQNSLLVMEKGLDADLALLPFKPMAMKVLQCSFLSGIKLQKVQPLLKTLQPKLTLIPEKLRQHIIGSCGNSSSLSFISYCENETLHIPSFKEISELDIMTEMASQLHWTNLKNEDISIARLNGELSIEHGKHRLLPGKEQVVEGRLLLCWGILDPEALLMALQKMGINGSIEHGVNEARLENAAIMLHVSEPNKALIEAKATCTVISTADENLALRIYEAIVNILNGV